MLVSDHIDQLRLEGPRLAAAAASAGLDAEVPSCPEWVVRDLVRHQGGVHRWAAEIVGAPRIEPWNVDLDEVVGTWPDDADLLEWFMDCHAALVGALAGADPALECWTFLAAPSALAMWARRQAHETTVHRVDAELAAGRSTTPVPPPFAADGIDELLCCFITRRGGPRSSTSRTLRLQCLDAEGDWVVRLGTDGFRTTRGADDAQCLVAGPAADLYLTLWNRRRSDDLAIVGDAGALRQFLDVVHIRWS